MDARVRFHAGVNRLGSAQLGGICYTEYPVFKVIVTDLQPPEMYFIKRKIPETLDHQVCCLAF